MTGTARIAALLLLAAPAIAQAQAPTLEQRVQRMEAESGIRRILIEYGAYLDARDFASYAALFAENGEWVGGFGRFTGPAAIEAMLRENLGSPEPDFINKSNFHMLTNPIITIDGDRAHASSKYLFWTRSDDNAPKPLLAGRYEDELALIGGEWKILRRTTYGQIPYRDPNAPEAAVAGPGPAASPSSTERLRRVEDQLAIQRILVEYSARLDAHDYDGYAALFADDGIWQNGATVRQGPGEIRQMLVGLFGESKPGFVNAESYHLVSNPQVDVDGDRATARSRHLLIIRGPDGDPTPALAGLYEDQFVRVNGVWKIARRVDNPIMPTREEWLAKMQDGAGD